MASVWITPTVVSVLYFAALLGSLFWVLADGENARELYNEYGIENNEECARYLDRIRSVTFIRYSFLIASITGFTTFLLQFFFGLFAGCTSYPMAAQVGVSLLVFVLVLFTSFKIQNCWLVRVLCGSNECAKRPPGCGSRQ